MALIGNIQTASGLSLAVGAGAAAGKAVDVPATATRSGIPVSREALETAARLKIRLGAQGRVCAITGLAADDGFSQLAATLATALATIDTAADVLIVDANVADARLHETFQTPRQPGFTDLLTLKTKLADAVVRLNLKNLYFLPAGEAGTSLASLLSAQAADGLLEEIRHRFRYVVINGGVLQSGPDSMLVAAKSDGVVVALAEGARRRHEVQRFQADLKQLQIPLCGVVLTRP